MIITTPGEQPTYTGNKTITGTLTVTGTLTIGTTAILTADAANTLAQRNAANAQTLRVYNTFTDASNYERAYARWASNVLEIGAEQAGTGSQRTMRLGGTNTSLALRTNGVDAWNIDVSGNLTPVSSNRSISIVLGTTAAGGTLLLTEIAEPSNPALNNGTLFLKDSGGGKTQLCVRFGTGATQVIATEP